MGVGTARRRSCSPRRSRSEEHTSELQSHSDLHSFPTRRSSDLDRGISVMSGSDTGNASAFSHGRWHGKEAELFAKEVGMPPMEAIVANTSRNAWLMGLKGEVGVLAPSKLADIVIWNSDPLAGITVLQRPREI